MARQLILTMTPVFEAYMYQAGHCDHTTYRIRTVDFEERN